MPEYRFSLTFIFSDKERISDSVLIREYTSQRKPVFWHISRIVSYPEMLSIQLKPIEKVSVKEVTLPS